MVYTISHFIFYNDAMNNTFFGGKGKYVYSTTGNVTIDNLIDNNISSETYFSIDHNSTTTLDNTGNHQFIYGWTNDTHTYSWVIVLSFYTMYYCDRHSTSTYNIHKMV